MRFVFLVFFFLFFIYLFIVNAMIDLVWFGFEFPIDPRFRFRSRFPFV